MQAGLGRGHSRSRRRCSCAAVVALRTGTPYMRPEGGCPDLLDNHDTTPRAPLAE
jgi:hypothetical protein